MSSLKFYNPEFLYELPGFAWIVDDGFTVRISGQYATGKEMKLLKESFEDQVRLSFENLKRCLDVAGCTERDLAHVVLYIVADPGDEGQEAFNRDVETVIRVKLEVLPEATPAAELIPLPRLILENQRFEVSAVARRSG
ncbi:Rid family hydrolase [Mycolicibacterium sp. XJ1819]